MTRRGVNGFRRDEAGAVTVDWVVLTAAIVGIAIAVISTIKTGVEATATEISTAVTAVLT
jgi:Flp pilus assembly pilin Flp